jgi:hypothetical protein
MGRSGGEREERRVGGRMRLEGEGEGVGVGVEEESF